MAQVEKASPDGYTLALLSNGTAISVPLFNHLPFDPLKEFVPISTIGYFTCDFMVNAASPYQTLGDFLKAAKEKPGTLNVGTINVGGTQNLTAELFKAMAGIDVVIVPFRGSPDVVVALLRNDVQLAIDFYAALKPTLDGGKARIIATSAPRRSPELPNVPTVQEGGVAGFDVTAWNGLYAPAGTPDAIIQTLNKALHEVLADPDLKKRALDLGGEGLVALALFAGLLLTAAMLATAGVAPEQKVLDLGDRMRCRECDERGRAVVSIRWAASAAI